MFQGNEGLSEPLYTIPDAIHSLSPDAKIIFIMRDPVKRLFSRWLTWIPYLRNVDPDYAKPSAESFHRKSAAAIDLYQKCFRQYGVRQCAYDGFLYGKARMRLQESIYSVYIRDWLKAFPREQILFLKFEDYVKDFPKSLNVIFQFLGLRKLSTEELLKISKDEVKNKGRNYDKVPTMSNKTKLMLQKFYSPFVAELRNMLGDNFYWGY